MHTGAPRHTGTQGKYTEAHKGAHRRTQRHTDIAVHTEAHRGAHRRTRTCPPVHSASSTLRAGCEDTRVFVELRPSSQEAREEPDGHVAWRIRAPHGCTGGEVSACGLVGFVGETIGSLE